MIQFSVLFSVASFPAESDEYYDDENSNIAGLAEWFLTIPDLFLLLLGADAQATPFAIYREPGTNKALVVETVKAQQRWQAFYKLASAAAPHLAAQLTQIDSLLMATKHAYLALDVWSSVPEKGQAKRAYSAHLVVLHKRAKCLESALLQSSPEYLQAPILELLKNSQQTLGYWSSELIARSGDIDYEPIADNPLLTGLVELEDINNDARADGWLRDIPAYVVRKKGEPKDTAAVGVVTPYGRWLVPLTLGMNQIQDVGSSYQNEILHGWLVALYWRRDDKKFETLEHNAVLFDVNGVQFTPVIKNTGLYIHSPMVATLNSHYIGHDRDYNDLVRLPDLSVLVERTVRGVEYSEDGYLHYGKSYSIFFDGKMHEEEFKGIMTIEGKMLIPANQYASISEFSKSKKLALVSKLDISRLDSERRLLYGVIDIAGNEIVPCQYARIGGDGLPKVYQKDRLLALDHNNCPSIYKTNGELVCATPYIVHIAHLMGGVKIVNDCVIVMHEDYMWLMSFDGELVQRDMSIADFQLHLKKVFASTSYRSVTKQDVLNADPWDTLYSLSYCLCLGDESNAAAICTNINTYLNKVEDDPENDQYGSASWLVKEHQSDLAILLPLVFSEACERGFARQTDWNDTDAISELDCYIDVLDGFIWHANGNGDSITDGISAASRYAQKSGVHLFLLEPGDGSNMICFVRDADKATLQELTSNLGVTIQF